MSHLLNGGQSIRDFNKLKSSRAKTSLKEESWELKEKTRDNFRKCSFCARVLFTYCCFSHDEHSFLRSTVEFAVEFHDRSNLRNWETQKLFVFVRDVLLILFSWGCCGRGLLHSGSYSVPPLGNPRFHTAASVKQR